MRRTLYQLVFVCAALLFTACGAVVQNPVAVSDPNYQATIPEESYKISVGDSLDIKFYHNPELNETVIVRPDGRISLQLVHDVKAAGRTPEELRRVLADEYKKEVRIPDIAIILRTFSNHKVYVDGEVARGGMQPLLGHMTALQSISSAGGFRETARRDEVIIIRKGKNGKPAPITVNLDSAISGEDMTNDIALAPNDIIFVPRSSIANVNLWVDQYIRKNIPLPIGVGLGYYLNSN